MAKEFVTGKRVGDYEILSTLGAGGMGKVYKVRNVISDRIEAMKVLLPDMVDQKDRADRFLREIKLLARLNHPNIAELRTALTVENQLVMIMEFVEGVTLASRLKNGPIPISDACRYTDEVLSALSYAHQQNIIHRDIKPANIMVTPQDSVKLMDFGLARSTEDRSLTTAGTTLGSLFYMPPEQVTGEPADARSDIYSLGVSLYEMTTSNPPFHGESTYSLLEAHLKQSPKPPIELRPDLPPALNEIILIALAKDPARRFQSADAFRAALNTLAEGAGALTAPLFPATQVGTQVLPAATAQLGADAWPLAQPAIASGLFQSGQPPAPTDSSPTSTPYRASGHALAAAPLTDRPATPPSYRGWYITLGAMIVVVALVAAGFYVPRRVKTQASPVVLSSTTDNSSNSSSNASPSASDSLRDGAAEASSTAAPENAGASNATPSRSENLPSSLSPHKAGGAAGATAKSVSKPAGTAPASALSAADSKAEGVVSGDNKNAAPGVSSTDRPPKTLPQTASDAGGQQGRASDAARLEEAQQRMILLTSRSGAVDDSLDNLRRQQSAQGLGLRGDISASQQRMRTYMSAAQAALDRGDEQGAKKYQDLAETELNQLEKFLGR
jgi:eukaryotic-like serine/threonine-protein kinase